MTTALIRGFNWFTKITAWPLQKILFRPKYYYEDKSVQSRKIKGSAMIVSNHTALLDYPTFMFTFFGRTLRYQMAEILFKKKGLGVMLKLLGGIYVDRTSFNFSFMYQSEEILRKGGVVGVFPESRLPGPGEKPLLPFKPSFMYIALDTGAKIIPCYTNGKYFSKQRSRIMIGKPVYVQELIDNSLTQKENIHNITNYIRTRVEELGKLLEEQSGIKNG